MEDAGRSVPPAAGDGHLELYKSTMKYDGNLGRERCMAFRTTRNFRCNESRDRREWFLRISANRIATLASFSPVTINQRSVCHEVVYIVGIQLAGRSVSRADRRSVRRRTAIDRSAAENGRRGPFACAQKRLSDAPAGNEGPCHAARADLQAVRQNAGARDVRTP